MKRLSYVLAYTGENLKILARTILLYEFFKANHKDIIILVDSEKAQSFFEKFNCKVLLPPDVEKYSFRGNNFDGHCYPNIFLKFAIYELGEFGYTHCLFFDSDILLSNKDLFKYLRSCEKEILELKPKQIMCHKYRPQWKEALERTYIASCMAFNVEVDIRDILLNECKVYDKTEEWSLREYDRKYHLIFELPEGLITNESNSKKFTIFYHTSGKLFYSCLKSFSLDKFKRYREILSEIEKDDYYLL